jgi:membrane fusion protein (multidrug efflux system)
MTKKTLFTAAGLLAVLGVIAIVKAIQIKTLVSAKAPAPREAVTTAPVMRERWQQTLSSVGSLSAVQGVTVAAELDGKVVGIEFESGREVRAGDVLVRQNTEVEEAQLRSAEASVDLARINLQRTRELFAKATVSQSQLDSDAAAEKQAIASEDNIRATIAKKNIRAPFSGRLGIRLVNLGQNLKAGDAVVSLQALNPIYVDFYLPQEDLSQLAVGLPVQVAVDAFPSEQIAGRVTAINPDVDSSTRNVRVQATVDNGNAHLRPGMYVNVAVELPLVDTVLTIPATAVLYAPFGDTVYVVNEQKDEATGEKLLVVRQQIVRLGVHRGDFVAVTSGLGEGDVVVTSGVFRLRPGGAVTVNNPMAPDAKLAPRPSDS